ncbi:MAG: alpha/beta fold hydrolase [Chromatiales bacterium]
MAKVHLNGIGIHYQVFGKDPGPELVMIHGLAANLAFWFRLFTLVGSRFHIIAYDLRGHGYSDIVPSSYTTADMAHDLGALLDHLGVQKAHIVGHSFGGAVALHFSLLYPERVKTLTLADARVFSLQPMTRRSDDDQLAADWRRCVQELGVTVDEHLPYVAYSLIEEMARERHSGRELQLLLSSSAGGVWTASKRSWQRWRTLLETTTALADLTDIAGLTEHSIRQNRGPVLAIYGEYSHCWPTCDRLIPLLAQCKKIIVPGVGHFYPAVRPEHLVKNLIGFIEHYNQHSSKAI